MDFSVILILPDRAGITGYESGVDDDCFVDFFVADHFEEGFGGDFAEFLLGVGYGCEGDVCVVCGLRVVIAGDGNVFGDFEAEFADGFDEVEGYLVVVGDDGVNFFAALYHFLKSGIGMNSSVLGVEPDDILGIVGDSCIGESLGIAFVPVLSLRVVTFKNAENVPVSETYQMLGQEIGAFFVIHDDMRLILHNRVCALNEDVWNAE